jgi:hypothetical protein
VNGCKAKAASWVFSITKQICKEMLLYLKKLCGKQMKIWRTIEEFENLGRAWSTIEKWRTMKDMELHWNYERRIERKMKN